MASQWVFMVDIDKLILKFILQFWKRKNKIEGRILPNFKTIYKAAVIKIMWHWRKG